MSIKRLNELLGQIEKARLKAEEEVPALLEAAVAEAWEKVPALQRICVDFLPETDDGNGPRFVASVIYTDGDEDDWHWDEASERLFDEDDKPINERIQGAAYLEELHPLLCYYAQAVYNTFGGEDPLYLERP